MPQRPDSLQGITRDDFLEKSVPVFDYWLSEQMKVLNVNPAYDWIPKIYRSTSRPGASKLKWGNIPSMERWKTREESENAKQVALPLPDFLIQEYQQFAAEFPTTIEYFEEKERFDDLDPDALAYVRMLSQASKDTQAALAFVPFLDAFDGNFYVDTDGNPLIGNHDRASGTVSNATNLVLSPEGLDAMNESTAELFTSHNMPMSFKFDTLMVGDLLYPTALDIVTASGEFSGNPNVRNRYKDLKVILNPFMREELFPGSSTMWFGFAMNQLTFEESWSLLPKIDVYEKKENLTFYTRGRMKVLHGWTTWTGTFGSTGTNTPS